MIALFTKVSGEPGPAEPGYRAGWALSSHEVISALYAHVSLAPRLSAASLTAMGTVAAVPLWLAGRSPRTVTRRAEGAVATGEAHPWCLTTPLPSANRAAR